MKPTDNKTEPPEMTAARAEVAAMAPAKADKADEPAIAAKVAAGLTREQAIEVLAAQAEADAAAKGKGKGKATAD